MNQHDAKEIMGIQTRKSGPNFLVDQTKAVQYLNEIRESMGRFRQGLQKKASFQNPQVQMLA